jgi:hypothetical protein
MFFQFFFDPFFNLYIIFYLNDYFSFVNFTLNSGNNSKRVSFHRKSNFPIYFTFNFPIMNFFVFVFMYVFKLVSFTFIYVRDG